MVNRLKDPLLLALCAAWLSCTPAEQTRAEDASSPGPTPSASAALPAQTRASAAPLAAEVPSPDAKSTLALQEFRRLFEGLSEEDQYFFSDNYISNETSYLQPVAALGRHVPSGGAYVGVGPEQNFTYIVHARPQLAFIVDIRRQNALEHLLLKAIFMRAETRAEMVSLWLGLSYPKSELDDARASLEQVLEDATRSPAAPKTFAQVHAALRGDIEGWDLSLSKKDFEQIEKAHRAFFDSQLKLRFKLHHANGRRYPTLKQLLMQKTPGGQQAGFLSSKASFEFVRDMHREHRIIPVVGDFAGTKTFPAIGKELERRKLDVGVFYASNVEQYILEKTKWQQWLKNLAALPHSDRSLILRGYLDQGKRHPRQMVGHRSASVLSLYGQFLEHAKTRRYGNFYEVSTDALLSP